MYVRTRLKSWGLHLRVQSPRSTRMAQQERKICLWNYSQIQINFAKKKLEKKTQKDDA